MTKEELFEIIKFNEKGLITVIAQDYHSKKVRMQAFMNKEALEKTIETGELYYYSRTKNKLWRKGEESGNFQYLKGMSVDCDGDSLLVQIEQLNGISCHTGNSTCFYRNIDFNHSQIPKEIKKEASFLSNLEKVVKLRLSSPVEGSYTNYLFNAGINKILKKIGEEATETIIAAKDDRNDCVFEVADLMYHLTVMLVQLGLSWDDIKAELEKR